VVLDIVGMVANIYRRGVPYIRVPTTLLGIVDASVGVKNGVDYDSKKFGCLKNRIGSFYAPTRVFIDKNFIKTQDDRNIINGCGEILKLALVRSLQLFELLEKYGKEIIKNKFQCNIGQLVIELSIQIMLEELGPNLWEEKLERCVDFGHTFSKVIEMIPNIDIFHGEAVNVDGFICVNISKNRGLISQQDYERICNVMNILGLPLIIPEITLDVLDKGLVEATEHRNGYQRIPLITGIGSYTIVNDIRKEELNFMIQKKNFN
jgi:3-dehydroquinate synthase